MLNKVFSIINLVTLRTIIDGSARISCLRDTNLSAFGVSVIQKPNKSSLSLSSMSDYEKAVYH